MEATLQWTHNSHLNESNYVGNPNLVLQNQFFSHNIPHKMLSKFSPTMFLEKNLKRYLDL